MVEVKTVLDKDAVLKLNLFHLYKKNVFVLLIPMLIFIAFGTVMYLFAEEEGEKYFGIIFAVVFGVGFPLLCFAMMRFIVWLQLRSAKFISKDTYIDFKFDSNKIFYHMEKPGLITTTEWDWDLCYKAYETKEYFFIYISNMQANIVPKKDFVSGTPQDLTEILHTAVKKFKKYK